jgi:hypothetical protein
MPVAPPDPGRALRAAPVAAVHSPERNAAGPVRTWPARWPHRPVPVFRPRPSRPAPGPRHGVHVLSRHAP